MKYIAALVLFMLFSCSTKSGKVEADEYLENKIIQKRMLEEDVEDKSLEQLRIMRNEIFARHGYIFKSEDLQEYFSQKEWYEGKHENVNDLLTSIDSANIQLLLRKEKEIRSLLPQILKKDGELINTLNGILNDSVSKRTKDFILLALATMDKFENKPADTSVLQIANLDGIDGDDSLKTNISIIKDNVVVKTIFSKNGIEYWEHSYSNPNMIIDGIDYDLRSNNIWLLFTTGIMSGKPYVQTSFRLESMNHATEDERFVNYLKDFDGVYIVPGEPEFRDGLFAWDEFSMTFRLIYQP